jgi:hypothetical protein
MSRPLSEKIIPAAALEIRWKSGSGTIGALGFMKHNVEAVRRKRSAA